MSAVQVKILERTAEYTVHVPEIDREHQHWFDVVNRLHAAMLAGEGVKSLAALLVETTRYTIHHFAHEEELMGSKRYPGFKAHIQQHEALRRKARGFVERFEHGETTMTIEFTLFLSEWIRGHVMSSDRRLGEYLSTL